MALSGKCIKPFIEDDDDVSAADLLDGLQNSRPHSERWLAVP